MSQKLSVKKNEDFSQWYLEVVQKAKLADYSPVRGSIVFRPYGFAIWEQMKKALDSRIKAMGVANAYFPLFIPESFLKKEKDHVEGFSPELAVVTVGGGKELDEPLVVRPTSETIMYAMFAKWIQSWRDLPFRINQWANVVRWEKRTFPFIRTMEFLWQEGHTAHATHDEALDQVYRAAEVYAEVFREVLGVYGITGYKSESEKFAGSVASVSYEALMPDGKALQSCTSHDLGQNFSRPFEITFQDQNGEEQFVWQTCWGFSTRALGGLIMVHGDDQGLVLPPQVAPVQLVVVPIYHDQEERKEVLETISQLEHCWNDLRVEIDDRDHYTPGWKFNEWELKGVPLRLEIGPREVASGEFKLVRRDNGEGLTVTATDLAHKIRALLVSLQEEAYQRTKVYTEANTHEVSNYAQFKSIMAEKRGFISAFWCERPECEEKIKAETKATTRCLPLDAEKVAGECVYCQGEAEHRWLFAQAY